MTRAALQRLIEEAQAADVDLEPEVLEEPEPEQVRLAYRDPHPERGTRRGYLLHVEKGEEPCEPCRVAHVVAETELDAAWSAIQPARIDRPQAAAASVIVSPFADRPLPPPTRPRVKALPPVGATTTPAAPTGPVCGTPEAYRQHLDQGEVIDPKCWNAEQRRRRKRP